MTNKFESRCASLDLAQLRKLSRQIYHKLRLRPQSKRLNTKHNIVYHYIVLRRDQQQRTQAKGD